MQKNGFKNEKVCENFLSLSLSQVHCCCPTPSESPSKINRVLIYNGISIHTATILSQILLLKLSFVWFLIGVEMICFGCTSLPKFFNDSSVDVFFVLRCCFLVFPTVCHDSFSFNVLVALMVPWVLVVTLVWSQFLHCRGLHTLFSHPTVPNRHTILFLSYLIYFLFVSQNISRCVAQNISKSVSLLLLLLLPPYYFKSQSSFQFLQSSFVSYFNHLFLSFEIFLNIFHMIFWSSFFFV